MISSPPCRAFPTPSTPRSWTGRHGQIGCVRTGRRRALQSQLVQKEATQRQVYLNPQFRYQGSDGTRYRSQTLPYASVGMLVADVNGDGKNEVVVLSEKRLYVYQWQNERLMPLGEYAIPTRMMPLTIRSIDLDRDRADEIVLTAYEEEYTQPYSYILSFKGNNFRGLVTRAPYYLNVVRTAPDFTPVLVGQKGDPSRIFSRGGVYEMLKQGDTLVQSKARPARRRQRHELRHRLPGTEGKETDKLVVLTDEERLRVLAAGLAAQPDRRKVLRLGHRHRRADSYARHGQQQRPHPLAVLRAAAYDPHGP
ncbi:MAG: VCBS repeat-containing protein [Bilophila sp.]